MKVTALDIYTAADSARRLAERHALRAGAYLAFASSREYGIGDQYVLEIVSDDAVLSRAADMEWRSLIAEAAAMLDEGKAA